MLAVSPLRNPKDVRQNEIESFSIRDDDFPDFSLDNINFDDLFVGINDGDVLPDLEMDSEMLAEFSLSGSGEDSEFNTSVSFDNYHVDQEDNSRKEDEVDKISASSGDDVMSKPNEKLSPKEAHPKGKKSSSDKSKNGHSKRKVKVDWTPELHRRFVQAVEQLGVDKAVPSRILELMGIDCLTRHNIASHLQKYRSHRKHLLAREAEAASWNQRRQIYSSTTTPVVMNGGGKRDVAPWVAPPTMGFPPPHVAPPMSHFRPLHVWGHPSVDQSLMHAWPKHISPSPSPPQQPPIMWAPHLPPHLSQHPIDPSFWHSQHQRAPNSLTHGTPCFAPPMAATRYPARPVPGIPPPTMYKVESGIGIPTRPSGQTLPKPPIDFQPSKESIDAALGDVLSKPWLPLPLGLKQPSVDGVLVELHRQGISKIPPT